MIKPEIIDKLDKLPIALQKEAEDFIEFLLTKNKVKETETMKHKIRKGGFLEGKIKILDGFDDPLEEFKDYM